MTPQIIALIVVVISFTLLFGWVFWPGNKQRLEGFGRSALELDAPDVQSKDQSKDQLKGPSKGQKEGQKEDHNR